MDHQFINYWCHSCKSDIYIDQQNNHFTCPLCFSELIEEIEAGTDDPRQFVRENDTEMPEYQQAYFEINNVMDDDFEMDEDDMESFMEQMQQNLQNMGFTGNFAMEDGISNNGMIQIMTWIDQNDPEVNSVPPASMEQIDSLERKYVQQSETQPCHICQEEFTIGNEMIMMPCRHKFHPECLVTWLNIHNSCPICRTRIS